jgi:type I restriction enzyme S subunit
VNKGTPGRVCLVPNPVSFCVAQDMIAFRCNPDKVYYKYLLAALRSSEIQKKISNFHVGVVIPHFKKQDLDNLLIPVKDISEQIKIGDLYIGLSEKIELNNRINSELEAMAKLLYNYWFVQFDFPDENGKPYKSSGGKMVWNKELRREVPEGWENGTLNDIGEITGGSTPSRENQNYFCKNGIPWITPKDLSLNTGNKYITRGEIDVTEDGLKAASLKILPQGTVLLSSRAPIGYMAIARGNVTTNQGFKSFIPKGNYTTVFIYYTVQNLIKVIENQASGSTFKEISGGVLKTIKTCLPPASIIQKFSEKVNATFEYQNILEQENQQLSALRDWLLPMLMNGQLRVGEKE